MTHNLLFITAMLFSKYTYSHSFLSTITERIWQLQFPTSGYCETCCQLHNCHSLRRQCLALQLPHLTNKKVKCKGQMLQPNCYRTTCFLFHLRQWDINKVLQTSLWLACIIRWICVVVFVKPIWGSSRSSPYPLSLPFFSGVTLGLITTVISNMYVKHPSTFTIFPLRISNILLILTVPSCMMVMKMNW